MASDPAAPAANEAADLLAGRYELGPRIGAGGMADVHRARDRRLDRDVAVKRLRPELARQPELRRRFEEEAAAAARLEHPAVVTVLDTGEDAEGPFLVMECLPGGTFADELADGGVTPERARAVGLDVLGALAAAHELGILHRDVKPSNLLLTSAGAVKVGDFGIAKAVGSDLTVTGQLLGTPAYMPPERLRGEPATAAGDLYSLGVVLYEALAGRKPFTADTPLAVALAATTTRPAPLREVCPDLEPGLATAVERAMAADPAARFADAREMAAALTPADPTLALDGIAWPGADERTQVVAPRGDRRPAVRRPSRRAIAVLAAAVVALVLGLVAVAAGDDLPDDTAVEQPEQPAPDVPADMDEAIDHLEELLR